MAKLGFVGLGAMGSRVVKRLLDAGHSVTGYNRTKSKAQWLLDAGMQWAASPREVTETADIVFTMVTNTQALHEVTSGPNGLLAGLGPGKTYIDMSTVSPSKSRDLAAKAAEKGGIPRETALEVMLNSVIASPSLQYRAPFILNMPEEAWFDVNMMQKDMLLALELGRELDVPLPTVSVSNEYLTAARAMGLAKKDFAIVYEV